MKVESTLTVMVDAAAGGCSTAASPKLLADL